MNRFQNLCYLWDTKQRYRLQPIPLTSCESLSKFMLSLRYKTTKLYIYIMDSELWIAFKIYVIFEIQNNVLNNIPSISSVVNRFQNLCYLWDTKQHGKVWKQNNKSCESLSKFMLSLRYKTTSRNWLPN